MSEYKIKVSSDVLRSTSTDVTAKINKVRTAFEQMSATIAGMSSYWEGAGYAEAKNHFEIRKDDYENVLNSLSEHVKNLQNIAGIYENIENENDSAAEALPSNVIE